MSLVVMTSKWFQDDRRDIPQLYHTERDKERLAEHWNKSIGPRYYSRFGKDAICFFTDFKSNPRRIHPFARIFHQWYTTERTKPSLLVLKRCSCPWPETYWRDGISDEIFIRIIGDHVRIGTLPVRRIQRWWRRMSARIAFRKVLQEIEEEVAFRPGFSGMMACAEHFKEQLNRC